MNIVGGFRFKNNYIWRFFISSNTFAILIGGFGRNWEGFEGATTWHTRSRTFSNRTENLRTESPRTESIRKKQSNSTIGTLKPRNKNIGQHFLPSETKHPRVYVFVLRRIMHSVFQRRKLWPASQSQIVVYKISVSEKRCG